MLPFLRDDKKVGNADIGWQVGFCGRVHIQLNAFTNLLAWAAVSQQPLGLYERRASWMLTVMRGGVRIQPHRIRCPDVCVVEHL